MNEELYGLLGLDPEKIRQQQVTQGLLGAGLQLLAGSGYSPVRRTTGELLGQAGAAGMGAYQQAGESAIDQALKGMQVKQMVERQKQQQAGRSAMQQLYERVSGITPQGALAAPGGQVGPTVARAATIGQRQQLTPQDVLAFATNPDIPEETRKNMLTAAQLATPKRPDLPASYEEFLMAQKDPQFAQYLTQKRQESSPKVNVNDPTAVDREIREINNSFTKELKDRGFTEVADRFAFLQTSVSQALKGNTRSHGAIIYNLGKIYDPSGAVQEGDKATIIGNRSIPEGVRGLAERVFNGGTLTPTEIRDLYENVAINVQQRSAVAEGIASRYRSDVERLRPGGGSRIVNPFAMTPFEELPGGASVTPRKR